MKQPVLKLRRLLHIVTFKDSVGKTLKQEKFEARLNATAPDIPEPEGYVTAGWDTDFTV